MSKLEEKEVIHCTKCGMPMIEILLCKTKRRCGPFIDSAITRCKQFICKDCEICETCVTRLQELRSNIKRTEGDEDFKVIHNWYKIQLGHEFNIDI